MGEHQRLKLLCVIALMPLQSQEYTMANGKTGKQNPANGGMEVLNRYNEMHTKDYGE